MKDAKPKHVLFLCVANSARSQMAEGIAKSLVRDGTRFSSAGSEPRAVRSEAVEVLKERGIDISNQKSKPVSEIDADAVDFAITLCAEEVCPAFLGGAKQLHLGLKDPAAVAGNPEARRQAFRNTRDEITQHIKEIFQIP